MRHFLICGSHPKLSLAEAKAVLGGPRPILADSMAIFDTQAWDDLLLQERLAGTIKLGDILITVSGGAGPGSAGQLTKNSLSTQLADLIESLPRADRVLYGLTIFGGSPKERQRVRHLPIDLKKELKRRGRSSRWVTGEQGELSPAAVSKLKLTSEGYDFCIALTGDEIHIGVTTQVQDATAWSVRDYDRPFRDAKTGMLPPKLARMMVNLAIGSDASAARTILDPFCGGGAVIMESLLMCPTARTIGSDIDGRQVAGSQTNLDWLKAKGLLTQADLDNRVSLFVSSAQKVESHLTGKKIEAIVTEGFLGKPLQGNEPQNYLEKNLDEVENVWKNSLPSLSKLQTKGGRLVACVPSYKTTHGQATLDLTALAQANGYSLVDGLAGWSSEPETLIYARDNQRVTRQILVLEKL